MFALKKGLYLKKVFLKVIKNITAERHLFNVSICKAPDCFVRYIFRTLLSHLLQMHLHFIP